MYSGTDQGYGSRACAQPLGSGPGKRRMTRPGRPADSGPQLSTPRKRGAQSDPMTTNRQLVARYADSLRAQRHSEETIRTARSVLLGLGDRATRRLEDLERVDVLTWLEQRSREIG